MSIKHLVSALCASLVLLAFWLVGYDFNERGVTALLCYLITIVTYIAVFTYPGWGDD